VATRKTAPEETAPEYSDHMQALAREYATLQAEGARITARMDEIKKTFKFDLPFGTHPIAGLSVGIAHNTQFDGKAFAEDFPVLKYPQLYKPALDSSAIKENFAPAQLKKYVGEGDPRVTVK
jgi:hypothetical protein